MQGFEVLGKLGEGAYSTVFKVRRKADGCIYALKQVKIVSLNEKEKSNALNEIRILASVRHRANRADNPLRPLPRLTNGPLPMAGCAP